LYKPIQHPFGALCKSQNLLLDRCAI